MTIKRSVRRKSPITGAHTTFSSWNERLRAFVPPVPFLVAEATLLWFLRFAWGLVVVHPHSTHHLPGHLVDSFAPPSGLNTTLMKAMY